MYVTADGIDALMSWFEASTNRYQFLCLLVGRDPQSGELFSDLLDWWSSVNTVTREAICVFLFSDRDTDTLGLRIGPGTYRVIPGLELPKTGVAYQGLEVISQQEIRDLRPEQRKALIAKSQSMSYDIGRRFHIDKGVLPCILIIFRDDPEPLVIRTRGVASAQDVLDLFDALAPLAQWLLEATSSTTAYEAKINDLARKIGAAQAEVNGIVAAVDQLNDEVIHRLAHVGAPLITARSVVTPTNAIDIFDALGLNLRKPQSDATIATYARLAIQDQNFRNQLRTLQKEGRLLRMKEKELGGLHANASVLFAETTRLDRPLTLAEEVAQVADLFDKRLGRRARFGQFQRLSSRALAIAREVHHAVEMLKPLAGVHS